MPWAATRSRRLQGFFNGQDDDPDRLLLPPSSSDRRQQARAPGHPHRALRYHATLRSEPLDRSRYAAPMPTIEHCLGCPYPEGCAIGPRGDVAGGIAIVGEAPGAKEIEEGEPFRGPAGAVLRKALADAGLPEDRLFITNSVACRPYNPGKSNVRTPSPEAIAACHGRLARDLGAHPRLVIVALGVTAGRAVTGQRGFRMMNRHGIELATGWGPAVPTLHPARVLRRPAERPLLVADLVHVRQLGAP